MISFWYRCQFNGTTEHVVNGINVHFYAPCYSHVSNYMYGNDTCSRVQFNKIQVWVLYGIASFKGVLLENLVTRNKIEEEKTSNRFFEIFLKSVRRTVKAFLMFETFGFFQVP